MPYVMVDIESDGPIPGDYSMICFGAVIVERESSSKQSQEGFENRQRYQYTPQTSGSR